MTELHIKRIVSLSIIIFFAFFALFCSKESREPKEKHARQVSSEEIYPSEESLLLKREISQKIIETKSKILLIGLDAADWLIIDPLIKQEKLPHLAKLKREGAWGNFRSFPPILSPIVWTSIGTGKPPEKHGIADFLTVDARTGEKVPISRISRKVKAIWNIFSDFDLSCDIIGWWATWPAERINGHMVTERISYNLFNLSEDDFADEGKTYPSQLFREIKPLIISAREISYEEIRNFIDITKDEYNLAWKEAKSGNEFDNRIDHLRKIMASTKTFHNITLKLLQKRQADLLSVYFEGIDTACHRFMLYMPPKLERASSEDYRKFKDAVENFYIFQDKLVGELLNSVDSETTVIVISDHGFYSGGQRPMTQPDDFTTGAQTWHRPTGIVILSGKWIKPERITGATVFDIAPTLLYLAGLPVAEDMIGNPLVSAISSDFKNSFQIAQIDSYEKVNPIRHERVPRITKEDEQRLAELRALGYIGGSEQSKSQEISKKAPPPEQDFKATITTHYNLGRNYLDKNDYAKAEEEFKKALSFDPNFQYALYFLAKAYQGQNRTEEAIQCLKRIISSSSEVFPLTYILLTNLYIKKGEPEAAEKILQSALVIKKEVSEIHSGLGFVYEKRGDIEKAEKEYLKALELNPLDLAAIKRLFILYINQNRPQEAEKVIQKASSLPDIPDNALYEWGVMCLQHKRSGLAEKLFKDILKKSPKPNPGVIVNLGFCYAYQGRLEEAKSMFEKALEEVPDNIEILYNLGTLCANTGESEKALKYYKRALKAGKGTPQIYNALGKVYFRLGDKRSSLEMLRKSIQLSPDQPDIKEMVKILEEELKL